MKTSSFDALAKGLEDQRSSAQRMIHQKYVCNLIRLAKSKIARKFNGKIEPEDIVQSVFKSFFVRHKSGKVDPQNWNELWSLLATMTVRKVYRQSCHYNTEKRSIDREVRANRGGQGSTCRLDTSDHGPSPQEQLIFEELFDLLLAPLTNLQKEIIVLKLSGHSKSEISRTIGRTERTVHRAFKRIQEQLAGMYAKYCVNNIKQAGPAPSDA